MGIFFALPLAAATCSDLLADSQWSESALSTDPAIRRDTYDFHRDWGTRLLLDSDPTWRDPEYLNQLHAFAVPRITNYANGATAALKYEFETLLGTFAEGRVVNYTITGTAANNLFYEYAETAYIQRTGKKVKRIELLAFNYAYGGSHGRIGDLKYGDPELILPTPRVHPNQPLTKSELESVLSVESAALAKIESFAADPQKEIGGIFLEPVMIHAGLWTFRPEFLRKLRTLADKLKLPLFADEIMSGGGRTGKFWAYQNYKEFVPDAISFGKGLVVAGVFQPKRTKPLYNFSPNTAAPPTTTAVQPLVLLQARQILKAIKERDLLNNAETMGEYLYDSLQMRAKARPDSDPNKDPGRARGVGLMLYSPGIGNGFGGRMLPPLTITKEQIDYFISR